MEDRDGNGGARNRRTVIITLFISHEYDEWGRVTEF